MASAMARCVVVASREKLVRPCVRRGGQQVRQATTTNSGAFLPEPKKTPFGLLGVVSTVIPGLLIGATISKNIASFLEENDLFVPSDDDDDDD